MLFRSCLTALGVSDVIPDQVDSPSWLGEEIHLLALPSRALRGTDPGGLEDLLVWLIRKIDLLIDRQFGITHNIERKDIGDLRPKRWLCVRGHLGKVTPPP